MPNPTTRLASGDLLKPQCRALTLRSAAGPLVDLETRTCSFPFSSDEPVEMWFGTEILSHEPGGQYSNPAQDGYLSRPAYLCVTRRLAG